MRSDRACRCKAMELANESAEKQAAQLFVAEETASAVADVKEPCLVAEARVQQQPDDRQETHATKSMSTPPAAGSQADLRTADGSDSLSAGGTPGSAEARTGSRHWELDLAWAALEERRAVLEELLKNGPEVSSARDGLG